MKKLIVSRQGDVAISKIEDGKNLIGFEPSEPVLAHGEVTGHAHRVDPKEVSIVVNKAVSDAFEYAMVIESTQDIVVTHEEHHPIIRPAGRYEQHKQREVDWSSKLAKKVAD